MIVRFLSCRGRREGACRVLLSRAYCVTVDGWGLPRLGQFLTAVFEMRPTRRKAAVLERVRRTSEDVFWLVVSPEKRGLAEQASLTADRVERRKLLGVFELDALEHAKRGGLCESVAHGLARDVGMAVSSFIELKRGGHEAEWPTRRTEQTSSYGAGLDALSAAVTRDEEDAARDLFTSAARPPPLRPMTLARERDARIIRKGPNAGLAVVLNVINATDADARTSQTAEGINAATGEALPKNTSKTKVIVPLSCSKWHEQKFLSGKAVLRSSMVIRRGDRWFLQSQFEMAERKAVEAEGALGVDRGLANTLVGSVVNAHGAVRALPVITGSVVGDTIRSIDAKDRAYKRRTGRVGLQHRRRVDHMLHEITNEIVSVAKSRRLQVTMEDLSGFKRTIVQKRLKGARKNPWAKSLKRAQLGKVEQLLAYKLAHAGLPPIRLVPAGGTSITCSRCGHVAKENRTEQAVFKCVSCGFEANADANAAVQIARRGLMKVKKGDKLERLHRDMVGALAESYDDGGLGPLSASAAKGFVAAHASASEPNENDALKGAEFPNSSAGQVTTHGIKNARKGVLAERGAVNFEDPKAENCKRANDLGDT